MVMTRSADVEPARVDAIEGIAPSGNVAIKPLLLGEQMTMMEVHYSAGASSPLHTHQHESMCYVVRGRVRIVVGEETYTLGAGDSCKHPIGVPHRVEAARDSVIVEVKSPAQSLGEFLEMAQSL